MKCLFCQKETYYEPYSNVSYDNNSVKIHRCIDCRVQFSLDKNDILKHLSFFIEINDKSYYINQYIPTETSKGSTKVSCRKGKVLDLDFIENLSPANAKNKLKLWLIVS